MGESHKRALHTRSICTPNPKQGVGGYTPGRLLEAPGSAVCQVSFIIVKRPVRTIVVWLSIFALFATIKVAEAGPFVDFFRAVRRSIAHPEAKPRSHRSSRKQSNEAPPSDVYNDQTSGAQGPAAPNRHDVNEGPPNDASNSQTSGGPAPAAPNGHNVRSAKAARAAKKGKSGLLYGTPVPGKQGLVTSPFSPDNGYIDVRSFPPGTEVKDPYTGKIFLTP